MNLVDQLWFYQKNPPRDYSRPSEAKEGCVKPEPRISEFKMQQAIGNKTIDSVFIAEKFNVTKNYGAKVLREYCDSELLELVGTKMGPNGGKPMNLYRLKKEFIPA